MESTMFFDSGMAVDLAQRAVYIAHIPVCEQTKKTPFGVFFVCPGPAHGGLDFAFVFASE